VIRAAAQGAGPDQFTMTSYYRDDLTGLPEMGLVTAGTGVPASGLVLSE
jgi:hypothetical protein